MGFPQNNNVYKLTKVYEKFVETPNKKTPAIVQRHPKFAEYLLSTSDHEVWEYIHSVSKFYINRYSQQAEIDRMPSAKFWHKNGVTQLLFYRLLERLASMISVQNGAVGLPQLELVEFLRTSCRVSERKVLRTIDEAVELGFIEKTNWWRDERVTVCYLSPQSIAEYLEVGVMKHFQAAWSAGVSPANDRFNAVIEKTENRQLDFDFSQYV